MLSTRLLHHLLLLLGLQMMRLRRTLVNTLYKDVVQLFCQGNLGVLKSGQSVDHHSVMEIILNHIFKDREIISGELTNAVIQSTSYLSVWQDLTVYHILNVLFALSNVKAQLLEISNH